MTTAFMLFLVGFEHFEGWVGIDQFCPDNPYVETFRKGFAARFGSNPPMWPNAISLLAYDTACVMVEALHRAPLLTGPGRKDGLERIRFMPSATGGPRTHIACSPERQARVSRGCSSRLLRRTERAARCQLPPLHACAAAAAGCCIVRA